MLHPHGTGIVHKQTTHLLSRVGGDAPLHLGRASSSDCVALRCSSCPPYQNQKITAPSSQTFVARIGPSGDERGYMAITGEATPLITSSYQTYTTHTYTRTISDVHNTHLHTYTHTLLCVSTGRAGWGIAWYINDTLIPELVVQRGQTYTFIVYGGNNPSTPAQYHPFYITDSIEGGRLLNTAEENQVCLT